MDDATLFLFFVAIAFFVLFASGVPFLVALAVWLVGRSFGGPSRTAFLSLAVGICCTFFIWQSGQVRPYFLEISGRYLNGLHEQHWLMALFREWLDISRDWKTWLVTSPLGFAAGAVWLLINEDKKNSPAHRVFARSSRNSSSPWAKVHSFFTRRRSGKEAIKDAIRLGVEVGTGRLVQITLRELKRHTLVLGRSGRGKTETVLALAWGAAKLGVPIIYVDGKGDFEVRDALAKVADDNRRVFYSLDAMNPADGCAYDAFAYKNATTCKDMVVGLRAWSEPHYKGKAGSHSQTLFKTLKYANFPIDLHTFRRNLPVVNMLSLARRGAGRKQTYGDIKDEILRLRNDEKAATESLASELDLLVNADFGEVFDIQAANRSGRQILKLHDARESASVVYVGLPTLAYPDAAKRFASLVIGDLRASLAKSRQQWLIVFDEFSVFANSDTVLNIINMGRSFGASVCLATQSCADFESDGSDAFLRQVLGSVNNYLIHELTDPTDAELIAGLFSTGVAVEYTAQIVNNQLTNSASARAVHQFRVHPEEIKKLGIGQAYVFSKDKPALIRLTQISRAPIRSGGE
jgi:hypothetical protein